MDRGSGLGERVLERRIALGMSQRELAGPEMSPSYVSLIESGKRWPTNELLEVLARRLDTSPDELLPPDSRERSVERIELDLRWAKIAVHAGNAESAETYARAVLADGGCTDRQRHEALLTLAEAAEVQGNLERAIDILEPLVDELDSDRTREMWRAAQVMLCRCYKDVGDLAHAIDLGERALAQDETPSDEQVMLVVSVADAYFRRGDLRRANRLLSSTLARLDVAGSHRNQGAALWNASLVAEAEQRLDDAVRLSQRALALYGESDAVRNLGRLRVTYAFLLRQESVKSVPLAREQLHKAQLEFESEGTVIERARCLTELARCALDEDDVADARARIMEAASIVAEGPEIEHAKVELVRGHILVRMGEVDNGLKVARRAAEALAAQAELPREAAQAWREVAALAKATNRTEAMVEALEQAVEVLGLRPTRVGNRLPVRTQPHEDQRPSPSLAKLIEMTLSER
ncbi:MAG TPA: helix-turn-helix domain-containing protein [Marmoricola sp.]|nr:helix-turn-helix domain-containing protein [Marmoricola sp.]